MIIECPACATKYSVSQNAVARGRTVRCTTCGTSWYQSPVLDLEPRPARAPDAEGPVTDQTDVSAGSDRANDAMPAEETYPGGVTDNAAAPLIAVGDEPYAARGLPPPSVDVKPHDTRWPTIALLAAVLAIVVTPLVVLRHPVQAAWSPAARIYGLVERKAAVPGATLELHDVHAALRTEDGAKALTVDGLIRNTAKEKASVPLMRATLVRDDKIVRHWDFSSGVAEVSLKEPVRFSATLDGADATDGNVVLTFVSENGGVQAP